MSEVVLSWGEKSCPAEFNLPSSASCGASAEQAVAERKEPLSAAVGPQRCRILLIDDDLGVSNSLRDWLAASGHEVQIAHDGPNGLELAQSFQPEIVVCDIGLRGKDGYAVVRELRASFPRGSSFFIAFSAHPHSENIRRAIEAGFDHYLEKPCDLDELDRLVHEIGQARMTAARPAHLP